MTCFVLEQMYPSSCSEEKFCWRASVTEWMDSLWMSSCSVKKGWRVALVSVLADLTE